MCTLLKQCKLCPNITEDARYVEAIQGWKCFDCDTVGAATGAFDVAELRRRATPVDYNLIDPDEDAAFIIETRECLEDGLMEQMRTTIRKHRVHLSELP